MTDYLSPNKLRRMRLGTSFEGVSDLDLSELIGQASTIVDAYCNMPIDPPGSSFLGGTVTETHAWPFPDSVFGQGKRRIQPYHWPIRAVGSLSISVGDNSSAAIPSESIVINNAERWVEITALAIASNSGLFGVSGWLVPIGGLTIPMALLEVSYGWDIPEVGDRCWAVDDDSKIFVSGHEHWIEDATTPTVYADGVEVTSNFEFDYLEGRVLFDTARTERITVDYRHKLPREIPLASAYIVANLMGESALRAKAMEGLESIKDDSIVITRRRMAGKAEGHNLDQTVPAAAALLAGFRHWRIA